MTQVVNTVPPFVHVGRVHVPQDRLKHFPISKFPNLKREINLFNEKPNEHLMKMIEILKRPPDVKQNNKLAFVGLGGLRVVKNIVEVAVQLRDKNLASNIIYFLVECALPIDWESLEESELFISMYKLQTKHSNMISSKFKGILSRFLDNWKKMLKTKTKHKEKLAIKSPV